MSMPPDISMLLDRFGHGGVERVACLLANGLHARGFRVEFVVLEDAGQTRALLDRGVEVVSLDHGPEAVRRERMKGAVPAIAAYLQSRRPRLFHAPGNHAIRPAAEAAMLADYRGAFVPKITNPLFDKRMNWWKLWRRRQAFRGALARADRILVLSQEGLRPLKYIDRSLTARARAIHNPYISEAMVRRVAERCPADPPVILSVGRLSEQKNHRLLLHAAARLRHRRWRLRICGTGEEETGLRALAAELGIADRLELPGFVQDVVPEYLAATVMALTSRWEGLPAVILEAIACGCPVVTTASSPGLVALMRELGAPDRIESDDAAGLARRLEAALDGRLPEIPPEATAPFAIEASCDEHAREFRDILASS